MKSLRQSGPVAWEVYKARDTRLDREVAVKVNDEFTERFTATSATSMTSDRIIWSWSTSRASRLRPMESYEIVTERSGHESE